MFLMFVLIMVSMLLSIMLMTIMMILNKKSMKYAEKVSPFECGFSPFKKSRTPFSIRFFLLTILFIIFDIEIVLILPLSLIMSMTKITSLNLTIMMIMIILMAGLMHEWNQGTLNWIK